MLTRSLQREASGDERWTELDFIFLLIYSEDSYHGVVLHGRIQGGFHFRWTSLETSLRYRKGSVSLICVGACVCLGSQFNPFMVW